MIHSAPSSLRVFDDGRPATGASAKINIGDLANDIRIRKRGIMPGRSFIFRVENMGRKAGAVMSGPDQTFARVKKECRRTDRIRKLQYRHPRLSAYTRGGGEND